MPNDKTAPEQQPEEDIIITVPVPSSKIKSKSKRKSPKKSPILTVVH